MLRPCLYRAAALARRPMGFSAARPLVSFALDSVQNAKVLQWDKNTLIVQKWEKRFPLEEPPAPKADLSKEFPNLTKFREKLSDSVLEAKEVPQRTIVGMEDFTKYCQQLEAECAKGQSTSRAALAALDAMSAGIKGKDCAVLLMQLHDSVGAYRNRFKGWKVAFEATDTDQSGDIDIGELNAMLKSLGISMDDASMEKLFKAVDLNHDNRIQPNEFASVLWDGGLWISTFAEGSESARFNKRLVS